MSEKTAWTRYGVIMLTLSGGSLAFGLALWWWGK